MSALSVLLWISVTMFALFVTLGALFVLEAIFTSFLSLRAYGKHRAWVCVIGVAWFAGLAIVLRYVFGASL